MTSVTSLKREKATFGILCLLPFLAFLSLTFYSFYTVSKMILLAESGAFFLLLVLNTQLVGRWYKWWIIALNVASVAVTLFYHSGLGAAAAFFNLLIAIFIFNNLILRREEKRILHFITASLLFLLYFASNFGRLYGQIVMRDADGVLLNPNVVGMLLLALLFHAFNFISGLELEKRKKHLLLVLTVAIFGYLIYFTSCRSAMLALVIFLLLLALGRGYKGPMPYAIYKLAAVGALLLSLAFTLAYVVLSDRLGEISLLGKSLFTGREIVWQSAFGLISESPIFGNGTDYLLATVGGAWTTSAHNTLLSIWYTLGVIPTATVTLFFVNRNRGKAECERDRISVIALLSSTVICFFESFYADPTIGIFFELFLLSNVRSEK